MSEANALARIEAPVFSPARVHAQRLARALLLELGTRIRHGRIEVIEGHERFVVGRATAALPISVSLQVHDPRFWLRILLGGEVAAGESYVDGDWSSDDLVGLMRIFAHNADVLAELDGKIARFATPARRLLHALRRNTRAGSRRNIAAHYDLGNDFYELFLDPTMTYSCACFDHRGATLEHAQLAKLDRICRKLGLSPDDHLLEIGCGWGSLAIHAAERYGARVTAATISVEQYHFARERVRSLGLENRVDIVLSDYRELRGRYRKIASVEMIEAIGHQYYDRFFGKLDSLLSSDGVMLLQAITIADHRYETAKNEVDFIKRHVFPGSTIPSISALLAAAAGSSNLVAIDLEDLTLDYALTLRAWRERFLENRDRVRRLGRDDAFIRLWIYYLALCEGGFWERYLGDVQIVLAKSKYRSRTSVTRRR